jgi:hypothetical protein
MRLEYLIIFVSANGHPILVKHSAGDNHPTLIVWRDRAFLLKAFAKKDSRFPNPIYQEVDSVNFWSEPSPEIRSTDLSERFTSRITPVIFEEEGESNWWFSQALELIRESGLCPGHMDMDSGG